MLDLPDLARSLCASLFHGAQVEHVRAHRIATRFTVEAHAHDDLLQFDWIVGCSGSALLGATTHALDGCSFLLAGPGRRHAMTLDPSAEDARVYHVRVNLKPRDRDPFSGVGHVATKLPIHPSLDAALRDAWRLTIGAPRGRASLLALAKLAEAVALWPGAGDASMAAGAKSTSLLDRDLDAALQLMDRSSVDQPPTLDDLAAASHLSVRQFTRRFREAFGLPPMDYLDRKRLVLARQMLAYEASSVTDVAERMGFSSLATFSRWFSHLAGESPSAYRARPHAL
ncbi:MAG: helix-turn-helix transcriptional regulator [Tepidisphaeraceae bacterium]